MKKLIASLLLSVALAGCARSGACIDVQETIKALVEKHVELTHQIDAAGGMSKAPQDLQDAFWANQDELKAAYADSTEACAPLPR